MDNIERRAIPLELRVTGTNPRIRGHAAMWDLWSEDLGGWRERVQRGAFKKTIAEADIRALWNHNRDKVLGRNRAGTLRLWEDRKGLAFEIIPPKAQWAQDVLVTMRRGDVDQMSFGFEVIRDVWGIDELAKTTRTLIEVKLFDISPVTFAAYTETSAEVRAQAEDQARIAARKRLAFMRRQLDLLESQFDTVRRGRSSTHRRR